MKIKYLVILFPVALIISILLFFNTTAEEIKWNSFDKAIAECKLSNKKIIIDVFTDWCVWCKKMDKTTYQDKNVVSYLREKYLAVKLDAESNSELTFEGVKYSEQQFSNGLGITGYPSTVFIDENGKVITVVPGYIKPNEFLNIIKYFGEDAYKTKTYDEFLKSSGS